MYMYFIWNVCGSIVNETSGTASLLGNVILLEFNGEYHMSARSHIHEKYVRIWHWLLRYHAVSNTLCGEIPIYISIIHALHANTNEVQTPSPQLF